MSDSVIYKFHATLGRQFVEEEVDLIAEGYVDSVEEWANFYPEGRTDILEQILEDFIANEVESGWERADD